MVRSSLSSFDIVQAIYLPLEENSPDLIHLGDQFCCQTAQLLLQPMTLSYNLKLFDWPSRATSNIHSSYVGADLGGNLGGGI